MKPLLFALIIPITLGSSRIQAQANDSIYTGRDCNNRLKALRMPLLGEIGDLGLIDSLLTGAADSSAHLTWVEVRYGKDGTFEGLEVNGVRSKSDRERVKSRFAQQLKLKRLPVGPFELEVARLSYNGQVRLLAGSVTCKPRAHRVAPDPKIEFIRNTEPETVAHRDVVVEFILESNGIISDAWISSPSGVARVDSLALQFFRAESFDPAIVGTAPVPALVVQTLKF